MEKNNAIRCDVQKCCYNAQGCKCKLDTIKVTCGCKECTCCGSFKEKHD